jgi:hypothetical protein
VSFCRHGVSPSKRQVLAHFEPTPAELLSISHTTLQNQMFTSDLLFNLFFCHQFMATQTCGGCGVDPHHILARMT